MTATGNCFYFVLMQIETLGDAWSHGASVWMACADGRIRAEHMKRGRECHHRMTLDLPTLVATRGRDFPVSRLSQRLRCPNCGCREMRVVWEFPRTQSRQRVTG